ncbi:hypothetical protein [Tropicimonas marinistellae]|uniref:hypothetical protein n=1 Tax=Tropicimonas marinistellae TaxID=1739787 RepID=UPI000830DECB|nr:hypothetical protein [Tropicimonas marinistellae]
MSTEDTDREMPDGARPDLDGVEDAGRREALKAVQKYAVFVAGTSTVVLSADQAVAQQSFCSALDPDRRPWLNYWFCGGDRPDNPWSGRDSIGATRESTWGSGRFNRSTGIGNFRNQ